MQTLHDLAEQWATDPYFDEFTRQEVQTLLTNNQENELQERFGSTLEFGTGGIRGIMGAGTNRMNRYTVYQATEGLARYIEKQPRSADNEGVVIGYDSRHRSFEFAQAAAQVLAAHRIPVYLFKELAPTPLVSCEILRQRCIAGIVVTASHNPPEYNGYKVYWKTGGQVIPPDDKNIIDEVRSIQDVRQIPVIPLKNAAQQGLLHWLGDEADDYYCEKVQALGLGQTSHNQNLRVIYTALHGTGERLVPRLLKTRGFTQVKHLHEQSKADGDFPTVSYPNPEDPKAFQLAQSLSEPEDDLILANDPDADRLGVMVRDSNRQWLRLNGNQIGSLLLDFQLRGLQKQGKLPENGVYIVSLVSSPMGAAIAKSYGLQVIETLTGFKWIWDAACRVEQEGRGTFLFGMEESHGYLAGNHSGDKDGIWAAMAFSELTAQLKAEGLSIMDRLQQLYDQYGYHLDELKNLTLPGADGAARIQAMMDAFRKTPPARLGGRKVIQVSDLKNDQIYHLESASVRPGPGLPSSNVLLFELEDQTRVIVRPSGTEPKIKFYFNLRGKDPASLEKQLQHIIADIVPA